MFEKSKRGFAAMSPEMLRDLSSKGGKAAHAKGTAHKFSPGEARIAGQLGGLKVSGNREHMVRLGKLGGRASANKRRKVVVL